MYTQDLTPIFNQLLKGKEGTSTRKARFDVQQTKGFLKEAYRINEHIATLSRQLADVRQAYLSTAPPRRVHHRHNHKHHSPSHYNDDGSAPTSLTDAQREDIDANAKRLLRDLNAAIRALAEAETLHQETQRALTRKKYAGGSFRLAGLGATAKSSEQTAAEEAQKQPAAHHESILWYLRQRLQACGEAQQTMMEARLARMVIETTAASQKHALVAGTLSHSAVGAGAGAGAGARLAAPVSQSASSRAGGTQASAVAVQEEAGPAGEPFLQSGGSNLTAEQVQLFERGNQDMLKHYETTLDKVRAAEQSLIEISELQTMLVSNLELQSAPVDQMIADSVSTAENVDRGNRELKKALERPSMARYTFYAASSLCLFVVVWDFFI